MSKIPFIKMHGIGNDYVYIDGFKHTVENPSTLAVEMAHRHFGIGGDGLILIKPFPKEARGVGHGTMEMYNADGSQSEMCGNGLRCVAKYVHDTYHKGEDILRLQTGAGVLTAEIHRGEDGLAEQITIDMGKPIFEGLEIPTTLDRPKILEETLEVDGTKYTYSSLSMGNPHCVIFVDNVKEFPVTEIGPKIENHPLFPARVNVEFVQVVSPTEMIQRTWERGSGETWACGTGASAVSVVGLLTGKTQENVTIHLLGGDLQLEYQEGSSVRMTGSATEVFRGEW